MTNLKHKFWLWPDRTIGKRESRVLRDEHNAAVNTLHELVDALNECETSEKCQAIVTNDIAYIIRRFRAINKTVETSIGKAVLP